MITLLLYVPIFLAIYVIIKHHIHKLQYLPPTPFFSFPIIGHLYLIYNPLSNLTRTLTKLSKAYGFILYLRFGSRPVLVVSSSSIAEECFRKNDIVFADRPQLLGGKIIGYNNSVLLLTSYGPHWRNLRRIMSIQFFSSRSLQLVSTARQEETKSLVRRLYKQLSVCGGECNLVEVEMKTILVELTYNVIMKMIAGNSWVDENGKKFEKVVEEMLEVGELINVGDFIPLVRKLGFKGLEKRYVEVHEKSDKILQEMIEKERANKTFQADVDHEGSTQRTDQTVAEVLLSLQNREPEVYTDEIIKGLILVSVIAGVDTTATTMEWILSLLLNNPQVLLKAQNEIDEHIGQNYRLISESDLSHLHYLHCIIYETLRMYPSAPLLVPHESSSDCIVSGYHVPRGTILLVNAWAIQNNPKVWDEPRKFKPERFECVKRNMVGHDFLAFGSGKRKCPGENLGISMSVLTIGLLIQCFDWGRVGKEFIDMKEGARITMPKAEPLRAKLKLRISMFKLLSQI